MRALLDVNVLIALHDSDHVHHGLASRWFQAHAGQGWASCPLTQNGCLRIMAQPGYQQPQPLRTLASVPKSRQVVEDIMTSTIVASTQTDASPAPFLFIL